MEITPKSFLQKHATEKSLVYGFGVDGSLMVAGLNNGVESGQDMLGYDRELLEHLFGKDFMRECDKLVDATRRDAT